MIKEGVLTTDPKPVAIFGLHVMTAYETGTLNYRPGPEMASADDLSIVVHGKVATARCRGTAWTL